MQIYKTMLKWAAKTTNVDQGWLFIQIGNDISLPKRPGVFSTCALMIFQLQLRDKEWRVLASESLLFGVLKFRSLSRTKLLLEVFEEENLFFRWINLI